MKVFSINGFFKAPVSLIAREAGISKGLIFWYFRSKDELILEVAVRSLPLDIIKECFNEGVRDVELLKCIGKRYLSKYRNPVFKHLLFHTLASETIYPQIKDKVRKLCRNYLREAASRVYGVNDLRARIAMRTFFGSLQCYVLRTPADISEEEYLSNLIDLLRPEKLKE